MYYKYEEPIADIKSHRVLALNRGESEKVLKVFIKEDTEYVLNFLSSKIVLNKDSISAPYVRSAVEDAYKRLIKSSIEREIRAELKEKAASGDEEYDDALTKMIKEAADEIGSNDLIIQLNEADTNKFKSQLDSSSTFKIDDITFQLGEPIDTIGGAILRTRNGEIQDIKVEKEAYMDVPVSSKELLHICDKLGLVKTKQTEHTVRMEKP